MNDDEIKNVHAYLMEEWKINEKLGPVGPRGETGENASYYAQYFQHSKTKWDIDFEPNFWIDGYDILQENDNSFKVLNKYDHRYDATASSSTKPTT